MAKKKYEELLEQVKVNLNDDVRFEKQLIWIDEMISNYAEFLGKTKQEVLSAFEEKRNYWSANFYQESNQPKLDKNIHVYENQDDLVESIEPKRGFICPACGGVSKDYQNCDTKIKDKNGKECNWASYGLLGTLGKGFRCIVKDGFLENPTVHDIFMPVAISEKEKDNG